MRRIVLLAVLLILSVCSFAQLWVKEGSFKEVPGFVNINPDQNYQTDDNDLPFAVIKVRTENISDKQRRELRFEGNGGTFIVLEYKTGEVWVYLTAKYADYLKISHPDFSSIEFALPFDLEPKKGYELTLVNKPAVDEDLVKRLEKLENASNVAPVAAPVGAPVKEVEKPKTDVGYLTVKTTPKGAYVLVDNKIVGMTPYLSESISVGNHKISVSLDGYEPEAKRINIEKNKELALIFNLVKEADAIDDSEIQLNENQNAKDLPLQSLSGEYSVSASSKVCFSKGNLQYNQSTKEYRFAKNQWDVIGDANNSTSKNYNGWIDLFRWVNYSLSNIGEKEWRMLTQNEWEYLLNKRNTNSGERYAKAIVNDVKGVVLLPDNWNTSNYELENANKMGGLFNKNRISAKEWKTVFEANGAVFLPAAGHDDGFVRFVGSEGNYWSSTTENDSRAYLVNFDDAYIGFSFGDYQKNRNSVRLVFDAE